MNTFDWFPGRMSCRRSSNGSTRTTTRRSPTRRRGTCWRTSGLPRTRYTGCSTCTTGTRMASLTTPSSCTSGTRVEAKFLRDSNPELLAVADPGFPHGVADIGEARDTPLHTWPKFLLFYVVFGKNWSNSMLVPLLRVLRTPSGKSWIRHWWRTDANNIFGNFFPKWNAWNWRKTCSPRSANCLLTNKKSFGLLLQLLRKRLSHRHVHRNLLIF